MKKKRRGKRAIEKYTFEEWVYIILNMHNQKIPSDAYERVEYAFMQMRGKEQHVQIFKMHYKDKLTYEQIAKFYGISKCMAYRYAYSVEEMIRRDPNTIFILCHTLTESRKYLEQKKMLMRNDIWTYEVIDKLKDDRTPFKQICSDIRYKYRKLERLFGEGFTVADVVCASKEDFIAIKGFGEKTKMMMTVTIWKYYNDKIKQENRK